MRLRLARHPKRLDAAHEIIIEELLELDANGKQVAVRAVLEMLADLHEKGSGSRFVSKLRGTPLWELKPMARGGEKGGSRVYVFLMGDNDAGIVNCEVKDGDTADIEKLRIGLQVILAYKAGIPVFRSVR